MRNRGFTLTELMVSIALALALIVGVSRVFTTTSDTISAGQAVSERTRDAQTTYDVLSSDLGSIVRDAPFLAIASTQIQGYPNLETMEDGAALAPFRTDKLIGFGRGQFARQTGNDDTFVADQSEREAYLWLGHLNVNNLAPGFDTPQANPDNYFAEQWVLGRVVIAMNPDPSPVVYDGQDTPVEQVHVVQDTTVHALTPFVAAAQTNDGNWTLTQHRVDVAKMSIQDYRWQVQHVAQENPNWWRDLCNFRFDYLPFVPRPATPDSLARTVPALLPGVNHFIVEYAGDWVSQNDTTGAVVALEPDGVTDFAIDADGNRSIRWFGLARDIDGDGTADVAPLATFAGTAAPFEKVNTATEYVCVWGGDFIGPRPSFVRLVITQTDVRGRLVNDGLLEVMGKLP